MSTSRASGSPALNPPSKLPRFLQKQGARKTAEAAAGSVPSSGAAPEPAQKARRNSRFLAASRDRAAPEDAGVDDPPVIVEPPPPQHHQQHPAPPAPVPIPSPRVRTRSERPAASAPETQHMPSLYASTSSAGGTRIGDLPTRLSGWFAHTFSTSSTDLSLPAIVAQHSPSRGAPPSAYDPASSSSSSPRKMAAPAALLAVAKHGSGTLNKAMRYLLDSDAVPDRCADPIWLLGVRHPGWEGPPPDALPLPSSSNQQQQQRKEPRVKARRGSWRSSSSSAASSSADGHSSPPSSTGHGSTLSTPASPARRAPPDPGAAWPPAFYADFTSRRGAYGGAPEAAVVGGEGRSPTAGRKVWPWAAERTWSADTGWGCMLRTGQSLLANALVGVQLGRDWRRPPHPVATPEYAAYVRILTWFLDTPAPHAPFSVHRMALAGKELGTDVGQWFGPSVAAGAIKTLVNAFPECGLSVALATDGTLYQSQIFAASHGDASRAPRRQQTTTWGERPVLLLLGIRLGIEGVNPIYYETIKMLYTFPQSVGIAGGRPSSSYYFVGSQAESLFYLDPHNPRPAVPLRAPPRARDEYATRRANDAEDDDERRSSPEYESDQAGRVRRRGHELAPRHQEQQQRQRHDQQREYQPRESQQRHEQHPAPPTSPASVRTGSSNFSYHAPASPSPLQQQVSTGSSSRASASASEGSADAWGYADAESAASVGGGRGYARDGGSAWGEEESARGPPPAYGQRGAHRLAQTAARAQHAYAERTPSEAEHAALGAGQGEAVDAVQLHYCNAYSAAELRTFHCERVRKMPLSGLDPSMLIGFVCRDERDWWDFRRRVSELPKTIFSIQDEPPTWPADMDDDMGLESISEPDDMDLDGEGVEVDADGDGDGSERFFDTRSGSASASSKSDKGRAHRRSSDTSEEDPSDPVTPGPTSRFEIRAPVPRRKGKAVAVGGAEDDDEEEEDGEKALDLGEEEGATDEGGDIEDDWIDPVSSPGDVPSDSRHALPPQPAPPPPPAKDRAVPAPASAASSSRSSQSRSTDKTRKARKQVPVPVPAVRVPPPAQEHYPFPVTPAEEHVGGVGVGVGASGERTRSTSGRKAHRMHNARARDGGRTQSGGVRGILTDN
ncbi:hypothetical protein HYPSUDRAFT_41184 [Hypholoma sublateritium FD-334 SS-4]|uniref:Autophagy-related protein 4 n=1 Tax=Hypholoma sublateritium (strain FD-334 SS-4) TaxID=945553 RepID=A0A0D2MFG7_HYPSF|nr:hypothetical protein HYPSUDRAFT_41184 [Hypholoma sublateritium FD-334 SS-4]